MKILVVGATYMDNFGDMLFAKLIIEKLNGKAEKRFYLMSDYCKNFVGAENISSFDIKEADALLYMPGGYLGDRSDTSIYTTYLWFRRYFPIGLYYAQKRKPMMILAVDAGPCKYLFMRKIIKKICKSSTKVIVRNEDSKDFLVERIGISPESIAVTSDYAQILVDYPLPDIKELEEWKNPEKKRILLHINECEEARKSIIPALEKFYSVHSDEYEIVVASDQHYPNDGETYKLVREFAGDNVYYHKYGDPMELCAVIKSCDCAITYKLHVGIVAAAYSKSVIPIPQHYKKVEKYYRQIGHDKRVIPLKNATAENVFEKLEQYADKPIVLTDAIYQKAKQNDAYLEEFVEQIKKRSKE